MKKVFIQTYGCQMNEYDSEQMVQTLGTSGFTKARTPEEAQLIIINSCSVREKSENKALSILGRFAALKKADPTKVLAFGGCVGQTEGPKLIKKNPFLDIVFGTNNYRDLPKMLEPFEERWKNFDEIDFENPLSVSRPESKSQAFITITNGCDKFCSYCIVPFTRGRELSRSPEEILLEAQKLVQERGVREIMLLGQNVNSYWGKSNAGKFTSLFELLELFQKESEGGKLNGLKRLRYTTSHPRDFDEDLARAFRDFPILCEYLHLPFQSGSDSVLRKMRRFYTAADYLRKMEIVKKYRPDIALSTDIIVGFPGETKEDFEATLKIVKEVQFDNVYAFKYSIRPYTRSAAWVDDVSEADKSARIVELLAMQKEISARKYQEDVGARVEVLLEGVSKSKENFWTGRTRKNRVVHFAPTLELQKGDFHWVSVTESTHSWLMGSLAA